MPLSMTLTLNGAARDVVLDDPRVTLLDLLRERLPSLHAHFERAQVLSLLPVATTQWFISLFVLHVSPPGLEPWSTHCMLFG